MILKHCAIADTGDFDDKERTEGVALNALGPSVASFVLTTKRPLTAILRILCPLTCTIRPTRASTSSRRGNARACSRLIECRFKKRKLTMMFPLQRRELFIAGDDIALGVGDSVTLCNVQLAGSLRS